MINGDTIHGLNIIKRLFYFPQCIFNWMKGKKGYAELYFVKLNIDFASEVGTPSRRLSNMFWNTIDWEKLSKIFGSKINIIDVGCGDGQYGIRLKKLIGNYLSSYSGLDIYKNKEFPSEFKHFKDSAERTHMYLENTNVVISQSSLEHIEFDVKAINSITKELKRKKKPFIQFHHVPAAS